MSEDTLINVGTKAANNLLDSGHLAISALMFVIVLLVIAIVVLWRSEKSAQATLNDISIRTLLALQKMESTIQAVLTSRSS